MEFLSYQFIRVSLKVNEHVNKSDLFDMVYFDCQSFNKLLKEAKPLEKREGVLINCHTYTHPPVKWWKMKDRNKWPGFAAEVGYQILLWKSMPGLVLSQMFTSYVAKG